MDINEFKAGSMEQGYQYRYFMPECINHAFSWHDAPLNMLLEQASLHVGELNSFSRLVPDVDRFIIMHVVKEAVGSSRIEGTQTNIEDALRDSKDIDPEKRDDWQEVNNYILALNSAIRELDTLPLSNRLIKHAHRILLSSGRGKYKCPGEFRRSQNWIGGATIADAVFIPPAHDRLPELVSDFECFINNADLSIPHLIRIAVAHYQFETIHPFLDGNGRIGRLLIPLYLVSNNVLEKPLLYLSDFFEQNKMLYYDNLTAVRTKNDLAQWIRYFLTGVSQTAEKSAQTLRRIMELKAHIEKSKLPSLGKRTQSGMNLLQHLFRKPVVGGKDVQECTALSAKSANSLIETFIDMKILRESTGYQRNRIFVFDEYVKMF